MYISFWKGSNGAQKKNTAGRATTATPTRKTGLTLVRNCCSVLWDYFWNGIIRKCETLIPYAQLFLPIRIKNFFLTIFV